MTHSLSVIYKSAVMFAKHGLFISLQWRHLWRKEPFSQWIDQTHVIWVKIF